MLLNLDIAKLSRLDALSNHKDSWRWLGEERLVDAD